MKHLKFFIMGIFMITPIIGSYTKDTAPAIRTIQYTEKREITHVLETLTVYNPVKRQCDRTPLITASNAHIDLAKLQTQELRWLALSRNLLKRWKGAFHYGDTVTISAGDPDIDGTWVIQDTLNKRYKNCGDLLFDGKVRKLGKWKHVKISKIESTVVTLTVAPPMPEAE